MGFARKLVRNVGTLLTRPAMAAAYARWTAGRITGGPVAGSHFGARIGGFENFSNYWGTLCKIPPVGQFDFIASYLSATDAVCLDVGANIGSFSVILGKRLPACTVHAFEPAPSTFRILRANLARNHLCNVQAHQLALSDCSGTVRFSDDPSISQRNRILTVADKSRSHCEVPMISLDEFCQVHGLRQVGFLKVDCEGVEPLVLRGATGLLRERHISAMLIEVCPRNLQAFGFTIRDLLTATAGLPYAFHRFKAEGGVGERLTEEQMLGIESEDLLLLPG